MANPEHVEIVKSGRRAIDRYREEHESVVLDLSNSDLKGLKLTNANLEFANLRGASLHSADLFLSNFSCADMTNSDLSRASLDFAQLTGAKLTGAKLNAANLTDGKLRGADLSGADLTMVLLHNAELLEADLSRAIVRSTIFSATDLQSTIGLDTIVHLGPSTVGIDTVRMSNGDLPRSFLQGCGVSDVWIDYIPSLVEGPFDFYSCFISYSHEDKEFARQMHDRLQRNGIRCWLDERELVPGDNIYTKVDNGIRRWDKILLCCSEASLNSWWVARELDTAIERERQYHEQHSEEILKIIPLNLDDSLFVWEGEHAASLRKRVAADFTDWDVDAEKFNREFERVVKALRTNSRNVPESISKLGA